MPGTSNHYDAIQAIIAKITALRTGGFLTWMVSNPIEQEVLDFEIENTPTPVILIAPHGDGAEKINDFGDEPLVDEDCISYPTAVAILADLTNVNLTLEQRLGWRQELRKVFNNTPPNVNAGSYRWRCQTATIINRQAWEVNKWVSGFIVWTDFEELRTP
jgi:hypothetical protein